MNIREFIKNRIVYFDGGLGTLLQKAGLKSGERPEIWNLTHSQELIKIHTEYYNAGSNVVCANTFGANLMNFNEAELDKIIFTAIDNVRKAQKISNTTQEKFIACDFGSLGRLLKPYGDLDFEDAVEIFSYSAKLVEKYGADLIFIETMNDSLETKAAVIAVKESCDLPLFVSNAYGEDGKLITGATPEVMIAMLEGLGVDAIGINCSLGPKALSTIAEIYIENSSLPVILQPNAGLPRVENGETIFDVDVNEFCFEMEKLVKKGINLIGGCCGTTPEYIRQLYEITKDIKPTVIEKKNKTVVSSYTHTVEIGNSPVLIGERINPTGKKRFKQALLENDVGYILNEGVNQQERGVHILDVNVGLPDIDEVQMLENVIFELQAVSDLPLQIDSSNPIAIEKAMRLYNGKPMINSVNGKKESMEQIFPLVKKYGGVVVALTLDEKGIPETAIGRIEIAKKILLEAKKYGIDKKDIVFDTLAMTVSASTDSALITLEAMNYIHNTLCCNTVLGVSNISFGLPNRDAVTSTFFALALEKGLSCAILNPYSFDMLKTYYAYKVLHNLDQNCSEYISFIANTETVQTNTILNTQSEIKSYRSSLQKAIIKGFKNEAKAFTEELLKNTNPLEIVNNEIIPALDTVGECYEKKTVYLPQLLMSAETAGCSFEIIKASMGASNKNSKKCKIIIATVKGDIHDIGKNIVKLLLENYGFDIIDLGKDVEPKIIAETVIKENVPIVGLSALMTTTVPAMAETIKLIKSTKLDCKVVVGGAVLNKDYAEKIGADKYCSDAMETVRYAEEIFRLL